MKSNQELLTPPWESPPEEQQQEGQNELDFFISYTESDLDRVKGLAHCLMEAGYTVRYQHQDFSPGREFQRDIDEHLASAQTVIAVVSTASIQSKWCLREWDAAGDKILPVRVEKVSLTGLLANRAYIDLFGVGIDTDELRCQLLLQAVSGQQPMLPDRKKTRVSIELPSRCGTFIGREDLLRNIYQHLFDPAGRSGPRRLTLAGIGGTGKTTLALEYGHRMMEHGKYLKEPGKQNNLKEPGKHNIWYIQAEHRETLESGLLQLVNELQVSRGDRPVREQLNHGLSGEDEWLLVLDDAPDLPSVMDLLPTRGNGHILITSENPVTWGRANVLEVGGWSHKEATGFLLRETGKTNQRAAAQLVEELDAHPERLIQAASYIDRTGTSIARYLDVYQDRQTQQQDKFAATLALALDQLTDNQPALDLLRLGSFLGPERIPVELLKQGLQTIGHQVDDRYFDGAVQPLLQFSLVRRDDPHLQFSRLVQAQVRSSAAQRGESVRWYETILAALDQVFPPISALDDPKEWRQTAELLPHLLAVTQEARQAQIALPKVGRLLCRAGHFLGGAANMGVGQGTTHTKRFQATPATSGEATLTATRLLEEARRILEVPGSDPLDQSDVMAELGELHRMHWRLKEAISALTEAHRIAAEATGPNSMLSVMRLVQLSRTQRDAGQVSLAAKNLETAVRVAKEAGTEGRRTLSEALASYGIALWRQGRYPEAIENLQQSIVLQEAIFGVNHIEVAITLSSLAETQEDYGDRQAAQEAIDRMIRIEREAYGDRSVARCAGLFDAAMLAIDSDDLARAGALATEILELTGDKAAPDDPTVSSGYLLQAITDRRQKGSDWRMLIDRAGQALITAGLPNVDPQLALGGFLIEDGQLGEGIELAERLFQEQVAAGDWVNATEATLLVARARTEAGELELAERSLRSLLEMLQRHPHIDESLAMTVKLEIGIVAFGRGHVQEALTAFEEAHHLAARWGNILGQADALVSKGQVLLDLGRIDEAIDVLRKGFDLRRSNLVKGHPGVTEVQLELARAEGLRENEAETRKYLDDAVAATAERVGARSAEVGHLYVEAAKILARLERDVEASSRAEEAHRILQRAAGDVNERLAALGEVAFCMMEIGHLDRARELSAMANTLINEHPEIKRFERIAANELIGRVALECEDYQTAKNIADGLVNMLGTDQDIPPRLEVTCWLLVADIVQEEEEELKAVKRAQALNIDGLSSPRRMIVLRAAELNWRLDHNEEAVTLAEQLLREEHDKPFRLDVLSVLIPAALDANDQKKARLLLVQASSLAEEEQEQLRQISHRLWIADAFRQLEEIDTARSLLRLASMDLQRYENTVQDEEMLTVAASLYERMADQFDALDEREEEIHALEQAAELYQKCDDRVALANIMNRLALVTLDQGERDASIIWLKRVRKELDDLGNDGNATVIHANLGLRYLDLGEYGLGRKALERALGEWDRINSEDTMGHTYLLVPLINACRALGDLEAANHYAERAVSCSLLGGEDWNPEVLEALHGLATGTAGDDDRLLQVVATSRQLAERRLTPEEQALWLGDLARIRAEQEGWDKLALGLMNEANDHLKASEVPPGDTLARLSILKAEALLNRNDQVTAIATLKQAATSLQHSDDKESLLQVLAYLGDLQLELGDAVAAAASFQEATAVLDSMDTHLFARVQLLISLASAHLQRGARSEGVRELRRATVLVEDSDLPADVATVEAICRLAFVLIHQAEDRMRAGIILARAESLNEHLIDAYQPQTEALPSLVRIVYDIRGIQEAMTAVESALRQVPDGIGGLEALLSLVNYADLKAEDTLDFVAGSDDPNTLARTSMVLAQAFETKQCYDDAKAVLRRGIERLRRCERPSHHQELELLLWLSSLDETDDRRESRDLLERALILAGDHADLHEYIPEVQTQLGITFSEAGMWPQAVGLLADVESPDELVIRYLNIGRVMTGAYEQAIDGLNRLVAENPDPHLLYFLAIAEAYSGQKQVALDTLAQALSMAESKTHLLLLCAQICNEIAEYEAAIDYARAVLKEDQNNSTAYAGLAWALQQLGPGKAEECQETFQKVLDLSEEDTERLYALKGRAGARQILKQEAAARADYERVLALLEPGSDLWLEGWVQYKLGQYDAAAETLQRAIEQAPDRTSSYFDLALCQVVAGKPEAADRYRAALARLDELEPRARLAPLRVAQIDLQVAAFLHPERAEDPQFQAIVEELEASLQQTEALVVRPILPEIPA